MDYNRKMSNQEGLEELRRRRAAREAAAKENGGSQQVPSRPVATGKTKTCKVCGKSVAKSAKRCPSCGAKLTMPLWKKIGVVVLVLAVLSAIGQMLPDRSPNSPAPSGGTAPTANISYEPYDVAVLFEALHTNALKAEQTYKDKYVDLYGYLSNIDSDGKYISIDAGESLSFDRVQCYIQNDTQLNKVMELTIGDPVIVRGKISRVGEVLGYSMDIDDLTYSEAQPPQQAQQPPAGSVDAPVDAPVEPTEPVVDPASYVSCDVADMLALVKENSLKASQTYDKQYVEIHGFLKTIDSSGEFITVGADKDNSEYWLDSIRCDVKGDELLKQVAELTKDDPIVVRGKITSVGGIYDYYLNIDSIN